MRKRILDKKVAATDSVKNSPHDVLDSAQIENQIFEAADFSYWGFSEITNVKKQI